MNETTATVLRVELNRERQYLAMARHETDALAAELAEKQAALDERETRIRDLTETLDAAGASSEPWPTS